MFPGNTTPSAHAPKRLVLVPALTILFACGGSATGSLDHVEEGVVARGCNTAADCRGVLPRRTDVCGDGTTARAHFVCESGSCSIRTCSSAAGGSTCSSPPKKDSAPIPFVCPYICSPVCGCDGKTYDN